MAYDYKKEFPDLYRPGANPALVTVPPISFAAVTGSGNPNDETGAYKQAVGVLYAISYTIRMSRLAKHELPGFFEYAVPPLEGLWWMGDGTPGIDYNNKSGFCWVSMIRLPDFADEAAFLWAQAEAAKKKGLDTGKAEFFRYDEGLCVQCMHVGSYDDEPGTIAKMDAFAAANGYETDISDARRHHEIYLGDPRKCAPERRKTILRHPVRRIG